MATPNVMIGFIILIIFYLLCQIILSILKYKDFRAVIERMVNGKEYLKSQINNLRGLIEILAEDKKYPGGRKDMPRIQNEIDSLEELLGDIDARISFLESQSLFRILTQMSDYLEIKVEIPY